MKIWRRFSLGLVLVGVLGCGGNESYLPPPRVSDDEEEQVPLAPPAATDAAASTNSVSPQEPAGAASFGATPAKPELNETSPADASAVAPVAGLTSGLEQASISDVHCWRWGGR